MAKTLRLDFIQGPSHWRKTILVRDGKTEITRPTPFYRCTSFTRSPSTIEEAHEAIIEGAEKGWALLRGLLKRPLEDEPRARMVSPTTGSSWLMLDVDGIEGFESPKHLMEAGLGLQDTQFIAVYTSSYGFKPGLRCLLLIPLDSPRPPRDFTNWLWKIQLKNPEIADQVGLDASGAVLTPPIDVASCAAAQMFTVAEPKIVPSKLSPFAEDPSARYELHAEGRILTSADLLDPVDPEEIRTERAALLTQLRATAGMSTSKTPGTRRRVDNSTGMEWTLVDNPSPAMVTDIKEQGPFIRLNLNGGDSDAYWHPRDDFKFIYSFKGWVMYMTSELLPEYYAKCVAEASDKKARERSENDQRVMDGETIPLVALDERSEAYICGLVGKNTTWDDLHTFTKLTSVKSWLATHGLPQPYDEHPPVFSTVFDPSLPTVSFENRIINRYVPPDEPEYAPAEPEWLDLPDDVRTLVTHVMGGDVSMAKLFMDWVAYLYQKRLAPQSAWLFHGTQGTGKDVTVTLMGKVLGERYLRRVMPHQMKEQYTSWAEDASLVFVNEIDARAFSGSSLASRLNDLITGEMVVVRKMRENPYEVKNRAGYIFAANMRDAYALPYNDRRLHVPPRQEAPLLSVMGPERIAPLADPSDELLLELRGWMMNRKFDEQAVRRPVLTEAKVQLATAAQPAALRVVHALQTGDWTYIIDNLDPRTLVMAELGVNAATTLSGMFEALRATYARAVSPEWADKLDDLSKESMLVSMTELRALFAVTVDRALYGKSPAKFRQYLLHHELSAVHHSGTGKRMGKSMRGPRIMGLPLNENAIPLIDQLTVLGYLGDAEEKLRVLEK